MREASWWTGAGRGAALLAGALVLMLAAPRPARGEDAGAAREHYRKGTAAYNLGRYLEAAQEYERAYESTLDPALLFNVAQAYRLGGEPKRALTTYRSYLRSAPTGDKRGAAEAWVRQIEAEQSAATQPRAVQPTSPPVEPPREAPAATPPPAPTPPREASPAPAATPALVVEHQAQPQSEAAAAPASRGWVLWVALGAVLVIGAATFAIVASSSSNEASPQTSLGTMRF